MRKTHYRKLIRDRIPEIIAGAGSRCKVRRLTAGLYARALKEKIIEEARELRAARGRKAVLNELIDIHELVEACRRRLGVSPKRFQELSARKRKERGGFRKRLFLEYTEEP